MSVSTMKNLAKAKFVTEAFLRAVAFGFDVYSLVEVSKRIAAGSWSSAALELKKQNVVVEAQMSELLKFRGLIDPSFLDDFFLLRQGNKYLSGSMDSNAGLLEMVGVNNLGAMNPRLHFKGLQKSENEYDVWTDHLTGLHIGKDEFDIHERKEKFSREFFDDAMPKTYTSNMTIFGILDAISKDPGVQKVFDDGYQAIDNALSILKQGVSASSITSKSHNFPVLLTYAFVASKLHRA